MDGYEPTIGVTNLASRVQRLVAQAIDGVVAFVPLTFAIFLVDPAPRAALLFFAGGGLWMMFYLLLSDGFGGQSVGKRLFDIQVIDEQTGKPCTILQSFIRNVVLSALGPIDWVFIFGERQQRLGDRAAGTIVVATA